jgi:hypothetical protein
MHAPVERCGVSLWCRSHRLLRQALLALRKVVHNQGVQRDTFGLPCWMQSHDNAPRFLLNRLTISQVCVGAQGF